MEKMRVTLDTDYFKHNLKIKRVWLDFKTFMEKAYEKVFRVWGDRHKIGFWYRVWMGKLLFKKLPDIRVTRKGLHWVWRGLKISRRKMLIYRLILLDDLNRIILDACSSKRVSQVLFSEKEVRYYES